MTTEGNGRGLCGNIIYAPQKIREARNMEMVAKGAPLMYDLSKPLIAQECDLIMKRTDYIVDVCRLSRIGDTKGAEIIFERIKDIESRRRDLNPGNY